MADTHKKNDDESHIYLRGVPKTLRQAFGAACYLRGKTMKEQFIILMREWLKSIGSSAEKK